ncbi:hypothetical protein G97194_004743 [Escherichia coli]|nr:hypothetical protein G97194_004743 [Escherichia coli]
MRFAVDFVVGVITCSGGRLVLRFRVCAVHFRDADVFPSGFFVVFFRFAGVCCLSFATVCFFCAIFHVSFLVPLAPIFCVFMCRSVCVVLLFLVFSGLFCALAFLVLFIFFCSCSLYVLSLFWLLLFSPSVELAALWNSQVATNIHRVVFFLISVALFLSGIPVGGLVFCFFFGSVIGCALLQVFCFFFLICVFVRLFSSGWIGYLFTFVDCVFAYFSFCHVFVCIL